MFHWVCSDEAMILIQQFPLAVTGHFRVFQLVVLALLLHCFVRLSLLALILFSPKNPLLLDGSVQLVYQAEHMNIMNHVLQFQDFVYGY